MANFRQGTELGSIHVSDSDPTIAPGVPGATPNMLLVRTDTDQLYYFKGPNNTDWASLGGLEIPFPFPGSVARTIYALPGGSDSSGNGLTPATAFATVERALVLAGSDPILPPGEWYDINCGTGLGIQTLPVNYQMPTIQATFRLGDFEGLPPFLFKQFGLRIRSIPKLVALTPLSDATITAADLPVITDDPDDNLVIITIPATRTSWAAGALKGFQLRRLGISGFGADTSCAIYDSNDGGGGGPSQIFLCNRIGVVPPLAPGEAFQIIEPSTTLQAPPPTDFDFSAIRCYNANSVAFQGLGLRCTIPDAAFGIGIQGASQPWFELCDLPDGIEAVAEYQCGMFSTKLGQGSGFTGIVSVGQFSYRRSYLTGIGFFSNRGDVQDMFNCVLDGCVPLTGGSFFDPVPNNWGIRNTLVRSSVGNGIEMNGGRWTMRKVKIEGSSGDGIVAANGPNYLDLNEIHGIQAFAGSLGIRANDGAQVQIRDATTMTLAGAAGDVKSGDLAVAAYAPGLNQYDITAVGAGGATGTGTRIFERA